ncbi:hypothetical protein ACOQFV_24165 [Nocardiopsis changdeensis]|uniref:Uncharacterized protein n=1 Tax=Nocardiopsis changdeensis TaxID=2831969 RepID=A0A975KT43_9ACTN|nr:MULTISPECIES: hypothetical protein [Nocardiopsis]QUX26510.1 hypothetical protein KGD84_32960 [Nocardiopsis changdeensis]QYX40782.1 hypothetical protein K1J57_32810 [Nocardiopsis sp. MT53]
MPDLTSADIRALLGSRVESPVLYIDEAGDLAVGPAAEVWHRRVVSTQVAMKDSLLPPHSGELTDDDIEELLPHLQSDVDQTAEALDS